jgi:Membrane carboxypeptidase (penicillin-binding protein)
MARASKTTLKKTTSKPPARRSFKKRVTRLVLRAVSAVFLLVVFLVVLGAVINPPTTAYMFSESRRLGGVKQTWVSLDRVAPVMARSAVAAEDANFCQHWGFT